MCSLGCWSQKLLSQLIRFGGGYDRNSTGSDNPAFSDHWQLEA
jgi:hypothetical protein